VLYLQGFGDETEAKMVQKWFPTRDACCRMRDA
jgi:hypothetical protein